MLEGLLGLMGFARREAPRAGAPFVLSAIVLGAGACGAGHPASRAFGSTEIEPLRDSTIVLYGENRPGIIEYSTGNPAVWWTLDVTTGAVQSYGSSTPPPPPPTWMPQPFTCDNDYTLGDPSGSFTLRITDTSTNEETDIPEVVSYPGCPGADRTLAAFVLNASGGIVFESGPFDQLIEAQLSVGVLGVVSWEYAAPSATGPGPATGVTVLAAPVVAPDQEEIDTIDLSTLEPTAVVPAVPTSAAWATGAAAVGSLQSTTVAGSAGLIQSLDGHYIYPRAMSEGGTAIFAGPIASGPASELALFELPAGTPLPLPSAVSSAPGDVLVPNKTLLTWQLDRGAGAASEMIVWDDTDLTVTSCPSISGAYLSGSWSPDQSKVLFAVPPVSWDSYGTGGPLDLFTLGPPGGTNGCQQLVGSEVLAAAFSPDGDFMFWLDRPATGGAQLWAAAGDGTGARMIGSGEIGGAHFLDDGGARLEMILGGELDWLDLHDGTGTLHHVAEQVHGAIYDITGGHWLIMGYQWSTTDGTGTLAVINRDDGQVRPISQSVAQYEVLVDDVGPDGGLVSPFGEAGVGVEFVVVYVVRGRNPSPQDGIWRATITPSELQ
jgi:hypothetical protein